MTSLMTQGGEFSKAFYDQSILVGWNFFLQLLCGLTFIVMSPNCLSFFCHKLNTYKKVLVKMLHF